MLAVLALTARDSSARPGLVLGSGGGLRVSLGRWASPHPAAEPCPPTRGPPLYRLFSLSAVGGGECMRVPLLVPNSPSSPCTQLCPPPSCPLPPPRLPAGPFWGQYGQEGACHLGEGAGLVKHCGWASSSVLIQKSRFRALGICFINGLPVAPALCCVFIPVFIPNSDLCFLIEI